MTPTRSAALLAPVLALAACAHPKPPTTTSRPLVVAADPKLIEMTVEPTADLVAASASTQLGVRVQIDAAALPDARRPPLNLALVLDTSGSMEGDSIAALRASASKLASQLHDGDRLSVVAFHSKVDLLVPGTRIDPAARGRITSAIDHIRARGTTDLAAGLAAGWQQLQAGRFPDGINRIVLLSDGVPNSSTALPALIANIHGANIAITTLGLGVDYDSTLLAQMARDTGGNFHYIETPEAVAEVFDTELSRMSTVVGRNLQLVLSPGPGVTIQPMPGLSITPDGRAVATIGDLAAGEKRDLMIPIQVTARSEGSTAELVDAQLGFDDVIGRTGRQQRDGFVSVKTSADKAAVAAAVKIGLEVQRIRTSAASAILEAITLARQGRLDEARNRLDTTAELVRAASTRLSDPELAKIVVQLEEVTKQLAELVAQQVAAPVAVSIDDDAPRPEPAAMDKPPAVAPRATEAKLRRLEEKATKAVTGKR